MRSRMGRWRAGYAGTSCPACSAVIRHESIRTGHQACRSCGTSFEGVRFDPPEIAAVVAELAGVGPTETAPCSRHARNVAVAACGRCGQFMCALCKIDADGKAYCPGCFERLSTEGALASTATRLKNYAGLATLCILGAWLLSGFLLSVPAGLLGIYFCVKGIREKGLRGESEGVIGLYARIVICILMMIGGTMVTLVMFGAFR